MSYQPTVTNTIEYSEGDIVHRVHKGILSLISTRIYPSKGDLAQTVTRKSKEEFYIDGGKVLSGRKIKPVIISPSEEVKEGDMVLYVNSICEVIEIDKHQRPIVTLGGEESQLATWEKIVALPEHFSEQHLQAIVDGRIKDGDEIAIKCFMKKRYADSDENTDRDGGTEFDEIIYLDGQNNVKLFFASPTLDEMADEYARSVSSSWMSGDYDTAKRAFKQGYKAKN